VGTGEKTEERFSVLTRHGRCDVRSSETMGEEQKSHHFSRASEMELELLEHKVDFCPFGRQ
jgi:hypothetical protein